MVRKTSASALPADFRLTEKTLAWVKEKYPTVHIEETLERFVETALANGWMYADWQSGFRTCVRKGVDNGWNSIVRYRQGRAQDPKWIPVLNEVRPYGFRMPEPQETPDSYRTKFNQWRREQELSKPKSPVIDFGNLLNKRIG